MGPLARQEDERSSPPSRIKRSRTGRQVLPGCSAHDDVQEIGMARDERGKDSDHPTVALALVEPSDREDDGPVRRQLERRARLYLVHREEARGVDSV